MTNALTLATNGPFVAPGTAGNVLTSDGTNWTSAAASGGGGFSGANTNAVSSSAITLTAASSQYQVCQISSFTNSYVTLPNATTMTAGSNPFVIENRSPYGAKLELRNSAGTTVGYIPIGQIGLVQLKDKSTSAGLWSVETVNPQTFFTYNSASITNTTTTPVFGGYYTGIVGLSATSFVRTWCGATGGTPTVTNTLYTQVGTISGSTISFGSIQSTTIGTYSSTSPNSLSMRVIRLSDTAFVVFAAYVGVSSSCSGNTYTAGQRIATCTVSGTVVTFGTFSNAGTPTVSFTSSYDQANAIANDGVVCRVSDTSFALFYNDAATGTYTFPYNFSGSMACQIVTVSGTTMTIGTKVQLGTSTYSQVLSAVALSSTSVFLCYAQATATGGSTGRTKIIVVSVSGTTPTFNTPVSCESSDVTPFNANIGYALAGNDGAVAPSATQVVFNGGYAVGEATISGTVPTFDIFATSGTIYPLYLCTSSKAYGVYANASYAYVSITTGGFVFNYPVTQVLQTNLTVQGVSAQSPLGAQPTTAFIGYKSGGDASVNASTVIIGSTT